MLPPKIKRWAWEAPDLILSKATHIRLEQKEGEWANWWWPEALNIITMISINWPNIHIDSRPMLLTSTPCPHRYFSHILCISKSRIVPNNQLPMPSRLSKWPLWTRSTNLTHIFTQDPPSSKSPHIFNRRYSAHILCISKYWFALNHKLH